MEGYVDANSIPKNKVIAEMGTGRYYDDHINLIFPVKKNDYWMVKLGGQTTKFRETNITWIPIN